MIRSTGCTAGPANSIPRLGSSAIAYGASAAPTPPRPREQPQSAAEERMRDRCGHALHLAFEEDLIGGDPAIAAALVGIAKATRH